MSAAADVVLRAFRAVDGRDCEALVALYHPEVEVHEAPSLPCAGISCGKERVAADSAGERFDAPVLGLYEVRAGKLARAQMFHFDTAAILDFLARANR